MLDSPETVQEASVQATLPACLDGKANGHSVRRHGGDRLNQQQRAFAQAYVLNGGVADAARKEAGYSSPTMGVKCLQNGAILREIKRLSIVHLDAHLPMLTAKALALIADEKTPPDVALKAVFGLMDRAGMAPKRGPLVAIQNNVNTSSAGEVQRIIADIWQARTSRLSDISAGMADTTDQSAEAAAAGAGTPRGGEQSSGAPSSASHLTLSSPAQDGFSETAIDPQDADWSELDGDEG